MAVEKRFLKYVSYWTTSQDDQENIPSTKRQFELAKVLEQELKELNLEKVRLDEHGFHLFKYSAKHMVFKHGGSISAWNIGQSFLKSFAKIRDWHIGSTDESIAGTDDRSYRRHLSLCF